MSVPRQAEMLEAGRINQKLRTRSAIVAAASELWADGVTPTVAQAAEAALVSRTTAYRYFPTQDALLVEVTLRLDVDDIEQLVAQPVDDAGAAARVVEVIDLFNRHVFESESQYRAALRLYLDRWLDAAAGGDEPPLLREGRRRRWIETLLGPARARLDDETWHRLVAALCLLGGVEAAVVLGDVCRLSPDEARAVCRWAADTLLRATL